jgi:hypothetical protein
MVLNATFNYNISAISWLSVLLVEVTRKKRRKAIAPDETGTKK